MVKSKDKKLKKLVYEIEYRDKKVRQMTKDRRSDRSWDAKAILLRLKKQKLKIKEEIARASEKFIKLTKLK